MKPDKLSIYHLFEAQRRHVVPLFQRAYVWDENRHWTPLWEDISRQAEAVSQGEDPRPHFLGAVVLNQVPSMSADIDTRDIIDGQQRMTTLQLCIAAMRQVALSLEDHKIAMEFERLTINPMGEEDTEKRYKVRPTKTDQSAFSTAMEAPSREQIVENLSPDGKVSSLSRLATAYLFFLERVTEFAIDGDGDDPKARLWHFHSAFRDRLQLVVIDLDTEDDPQIIFETLNARGVPLLPSDLIRNHVLHRARDEKRDIDGLYDRWWRPFDETLDPDATKPDDFFWKRMVRQGRLKRPRLDLFFYHFLQYRAVREFNITRLYQEFCEWWASPECEETVSGFEFIEQASQTFRRFTIPIGETRFDLFLERLKALDTSTLYPALLAILVPDAGELNEVDLDEIAVDLESYLIRRMICRLTTKNYNKLFFSLLRHIKEEGARAEVIRNRLLESRDETVRWPDDEEFRQAWLYKQAYGGYIRQDRIRLVLQAIESQLHTDKQERLGLDRTPSIEHVMPQKWHENWPLLSVAADQPTDEMETPTQRRDRLLQTFGNLTLVTQQLNSSVSNASYEVKRPEITHESVLRLNAYFQDVDDWNEDAILKRGEDLFDLAKCVWPKPTQ